MSKTTYFYQALKQVAGNSPPEFMKTVTISEYLSEFSDDNNHILQTWAVNHSNLVWCTGMGVIEASILLVKEAVNNANIQADSSKKKDDGFVAYFYGS
jgi:hypothetical protein